MLTTTDPPGSGGSPALRALVALVLLAGCATGSPHETLASGTGPPSRPSSFLQSTAVPRHSSSPPRLTAGRGTDASPVKGTQGAVLTRGGVAVPPGWPVLSSGDAEALLAPFLRCSSPGDFVALQQGVDMPRLVASLDDWRAVRLGALGPVRSDAAPLLQRKRASFLLTATERYGLLHAEVLALFVLHSSHDDEVHEVLRLLARDKRLGQTLALMPSVRQELAARGLPLSAYPERAEQSGDVLRGLGRAARDALATSPLRDGDQLARDIQASREAGRSVAVGGVDAALALREARGNVAQAQAMLSKARPESTGSSATRSRAAERPGGLASLVDTEAGLTQEVVELKLTQVELESAGPRLPQDVRVLEKQRPALDAPPLEARDHPRWREYVDYYEKRLGELQAGQTAQAPLRWAPYELMWRGFARGLTFERLMVTLLRADAKLPRAQRRFLGDFSQPRIETYVSVKKPGTGLRFADVLVIEEGGSSGRPPRVETLSFKSRDLSGLGKDVLEAQMKADAREALRKYGETLDIRRDSLQPLLRDGNRVPVQRVRLVYEGGALKPTRGDDLNAAVRETEQAVPGVEVLFQ